MLALLPQLWTCSSLGSAVNTLDVDQLTDVGLSVGMDVEQPFFSPSVSSLVLIPAFY